MAKKIIALLLAALMCCALLCACNNTQGNTPNPSSDPKPSGTNKPDDSKPQDSKPVQTGEVKEIKLADYFSKEDMWEDDGGDFTMEADKLVLNNAFMGDFSTLQLKEEAQNVTYKFTLQLSDIATNLSVDEGTWWDSELMILGRSTLAAPGWEEGQTGYSLTAWGDMSEVFIGRAGHDDAFGSVKWGVEDGKPHEIEFSLINNEDNTQVTVRLSVDGKVVFEQVDDGSIKKDGRTPLFPEPGTLTLRCKYLKATIS